MNNIDSFKEEFFSSSDLVDFKLPTPQSFSQHPFLDSNNTPSSSTNIGVLPTPNIINSSPFVPIQHHNEDNSNINHTINNNNNSTNSLDNRMELFTSSLHNQLLEVSSNQQSSTSPNNISSSTSSPNTSLPTTTANTNMNTTTSSNNKFFVDEDVNQFLGGLDSSTFSISPWGSGGFNLPTPNIGNLTAQKMFQSSTTNNAPVQHQQQQQQQQHSTSFMPPHPQQQQSMLQQMHNQHQYQQQQQPQHNPFSSQSPGNFVVSSPQQHQFIPSPSSCYSHPFASNNNGSNSSGRINSPHNFSGSPSAPPTNLIKLVEGFNKPLKDKQIGGKDNTKHTIPTQTVELAASKLPPNSDPSVLCVRASVLGYDRSARTKIILGHISDKPFEERASKWISVFDDIVVQFSSHNNGQKLALRFQLLDADKKPVCHVDSYEFETITKRGLEKIKERAKRKRSDSEHESIVEFCDPSMGLTQGGQLVKVMGRGFVCPPATQAVVRFGEKDAREVHSVKRNIIVCETPEGDPGKVDVTVSLDKKGILPTTATFEYVDPADQERVQEMIRNMLKPPHYESDESSSGGSSKKSKGNDGRANNSSPTDMYAWASGKETDNCGFNMLHHACARGFFELTCFLVENEFCDVNAVDNYGRTALFWAMWAKSTIITSYLISKSADMTICDDVNDNFLHIASSVPDADNSDNIQHIKSLLFWMLKFDDSQHNQARFLSNTLKQKNDDGYSVAELAAKHSHNLLADLFKAVEQLSDAIVKNSSVELDNIKFRSGLNNGKTIKQVLNEDDGVQLSLDLSNSFILYAQSANINLRAIIPHHNVAFLILDKKQNTAQFTLMNSPLIESLDSDGEWREYNEDSILNVLSFNLGIVDTNKMPQVYNYVIQTGQLREFQEMCFHYMGVAGQDSKKTSNTSSNESTAPSKQSDLKDSLNGETTDKMHVLRMRMRSLSLSKTTPVTNNTNLADETTSQQHVL